MRLFDCGVCCRWVLLLIICVVGGIEPSSGRAAAFQNGSFESPAITTDYAGLSFVVNGIATVALPGWVATTNSTSQFTQDLLIRSSYDHVSDGSQALVFNGDGSALNTLSQTFDTTVGTNYQVLFDLSAQSLGIDGTKSTVSSAHLLLNATGNLSVAYTDPTAANTNGQFPYVPELYTFTATSPSTTLTFSQSGGTDVSPVLDNVRVNVAAPKQTSTLFNTGVDSNGNPLPDGTLNDPHWSLVAIANKSQTTTIRVRSSTGGYPVGTWLGDDAASAWIGPDNDTEVDGAAGNYDYRTTFTAPANVTQVTISGLWASDDIGSEILLNGNLTQTTDIGSGTWAGFTVSGLVLPGQTNSLDFIVNNAGNNPTGLRVEF